MSVREAQEKIDSAEFSEWIAYAGVEPFLIHRTENMLAIVASVIANVNRGKKTKPFTPEDFLPQYAAPKKTPDTPQEIEDKLKRFFNYGDN